MEVENKFMDSFKECGGTIVFVDDEALCSKLGFTRVGVSFGRDKAKSSGIQLTYYKIMMNPSFRYDDKEHEIVEATFYVNNNLRTSSTL